MESSETKTKLFFHISSVNNEIISKIKVDSVSKKNKTKQNPQNSL